MPSFFSDCGTDIFTFSCIRMWNALYNFLWIRNKRNAKEFKQCLNTKKKSWASLFKLGQQLPHCHWTLESPCLPNPRVTLFTSPPTPPPFSTQCVNPLSAIFQLFHGNQFYGWRKPGVHEENRRPVGSRGQTFIT